MNEDKKPSETAIIIASLRALSNYEENENIRCNDYFTEIFLPDERRIHLKDENARAMIKKAIPKGMYEYVIARTKYFDRIFIEAVKKNSIQIVFLGAGYDSRSYRFHSLIGKTKIFEVDTKSTQEHKLSILYKNKVKISNNIKFIAADFEKDNLFNLLIQSGFNTTKTTLFLLEGVIFYLPENIFVQLLKMIKEHSPPGSRVCFDFQTIINNDKLIKTDLKDETIKFGIKKDKIEIFVSENGYRIIEHLNSNDLEKRFLILENGQQFGEIAPIMNLLLIEHVH